MADTVAPDADLPQTGRLADAEQPPARRTRFQSVELERAGDSPTTRPSTGIAAGAEDRRTQTVIAALQPFQTLLGQWRFITRRKFGEAPKTAEDVEWVWDFQTDREQPSLAVHSDAHPYLRRAWLTCLAAGDGFQFTAEDADGDRRVLRGTWAPGGEPQEESDGKKLQRSYKLLLTQVDPPEGDQWQVTIQQVDNNQYVVDFRRKSPTGNQFGPLDMVRQQRIGTSFALADSDNPGPKCIISGGLGTMSVSYQGRTYPVCCSGCAAAFHDDPERWLAKLAGSEKPRSE